MIRKSSALWRLHAAVNGQLSSSPRFLILFCRIRCNFRKRHRKRAHRSRPSRTINSCRDDFNCRGNFKRGRVFRATYFSIICCNLATFFGPFAARTRLILCPIVRDGLLLRRHFKLIDRFTSTENEAFHSSRFSFKNSPNNKGLCGFGFMKKLALVRSCTMFPLLCFGAFTWTGSSSLELY